MTGISFLRTLIGSVLSGFVIGLMVKCQFISMMEGFFLTIPAGIVIGLFEHYTKEVNGE